MDNAHFSPRAVVFDFDGTLMDSLSLVLAAITHALEPFGSRPTSEIFARLGGPPERFMASLVSDERQVSSAVRRMEAYHNANGHLIRPFPGAKELLAELHARRLALAVWTGRDRVSTEYLMQTHGLGTYFQTIICGDDLPTHKPDSEGLREILRRLGIGGADTLLVGDADVDVLGGVGCGVNTLLISHARAIPAEIQRQAWRTAESPAAAFRVVRELVRSVR